MWKNLPFFQVPTLLFVSNSKPVFYCSPQTLSRKLNPDYTSCRYLQVGNAHGLGQFSLFYSLRSTGLHGLGQTHMHIVLSLWWTDGVYTYTVASHSNWEVPVHLDFSIPWPKHSLNISFFQIYKIPTKNVFRSRLDMITTTTTTTTSL